MSRSRLLFIDEEPESLAALAQSLRSLRRRWEMHFEAGADQGQDLLAEGAYDAVVLSIGRASRRGLRLLRRIRADRRMRDIPVLVLTGPDDRHIKRRAIRLGATDLLTRPLHREDLLIRLAGALALKRRQDEIKALNEALERKVAQRTAELERSRLDVIWRLAKVGEYRDEETGNHIVRVGRYCRVLAEKLGLGADQTENLALAAPLHDIGKVGIPDRILLNQGRLTPGDWSTLEQHCAIGSDILLQEPRGWPTARPAGEGPATGNENQIVKLAASIALTHHERWDGKGYPLGLRGRNIPLESRIVAVADVYDALRSARPYKKGYPHDKTLTLIAEERGSHFDPDVYDAFRQISGAFRSIRLECSDNDGTTIRVRRISLSAAGAAGPTHGEHT